MASRHDRATQERRRRLRERQENERKEFRRRQQAQMAALNDIDGAVERFEAARAAVAAALANAVQVFPSVEALAEVTAFDAKEIRAYERRHRREQQGAQRRPVTGEQVPQQASGEAEPVTVPTG